MNKKLFDFINLHGTYYGNDLHIMDNSGPNTLLGGRTYWVWLKSGVHFEISKDRDEKGEWEYYFYPKWVGPLECDTAEKVITVLRLTGHPEIDQVN